MSQVQRKTLSLFPREWEIVRQVQELYNLKCSQAVRVIINEYADTHGLTIPEEVPAGQLWVGLQISVEWFGSNSEAKKQFAHGPNLLRQASRHGWCSFQSRMDTTEIVQTPRPEHRRLQMEPMTGWHAGTTGQRRYPGTEGRIQSFDVGGVENAQLCLRPAKNLLGRHPMTQTKAAFDGYQAATDFVFDHLHQMDLRPQAQRGVSRFAGVVGTTEDAAHRFDPGTEAIRHPKNGGVRFGRVPYPCHHPLYQGGTPLHTHLAPEKQTRENAHRRRHPGSAMLRFQVQFIPLHLSQFQPARAHPLRLDLLRMLTCFHLPCLHRALVQAKGKDNSR